MSQTLRSPDAYEIMQMQVVDLVSQFSPLYPGSMYRIFINNSFLQKTSKSLRFQASKSTNILRYLFFDGSPAALRVAAPAVSLGVVMMDELFKARSHENNFTFVTSSVHIGVASGRRRMKGKGVRRSWWTKDAMQT